MPLTTVSDQALKNPLESIVNVKDSRGHRYREWDPLSLMILAGLALIDAPWSSHALRKPAGSR